MIGDHISESSDWGSCRISTAMDHARHSVDQGLQKDTISADGLYHVHRSSGVRVAYRIRQSKIGGGQSLHASREYSVDDVEMLGYQEKE